MALKIAVVRQNTVPGDVTRNRVISADVHPDRVAGHRRANPWYTGRRPELYA